MPRPLRRWAVATMLVTCACGRSEPEKTTTVSSASAAVSAPAPVPPPPAKPAVVAHWRRNVGLKAPESVLHDPVSDTYLVSNVDGKPLDVDNRAFISKLAPLGQGVELKWIESGKNKVVLNAPKGMALTADTLWVADIDTVRTFNRTSGMPTGDIKIPGATFLNDLATTGDGRVLVTDSGLRTAKDGGLEPSGSDAVYIIEKDRKVTTIAKHKGLNGPNGILAFGDGKMYVVTMGSGEMYSLDMKGERENAIRLPKGTLDGVAFGRDAYFVSSWDANAIYRGMPTGNFEVYIDDVKSAADLAYDKSRNRLLVAIMGEDEVRAYEIK